MQSQLRFPAFIRGAGRQWGQDGRPSGRKIAENNAHGAGKKKGDDHDAGVEDKGDLQQPGQPERAGKGEQDADETAEGGKHHGLHQELQQHFALQGADGQTDADLPGAFGHRDQHDVHDADAAHQQADRCHGAQQGGQGSGWCR